MAKQPVLATSLSQEARNTKSSGSPGFAVLRSLPLIREMGREPWGLTPPKTQPISGEKTWVCSVQISNGKQVRRQQSSLFLPVGVRWLTWQLNARRPQGGQQCIYRRSSHFSPVILRYGGDTSWSSKPSSFIRQEGSHRHSWSHNLVLRLLWQRYSW